MYRLIKISTKYSKNTWGCPQVFFVLFFLLAVGDFRQIYAVQCIPAPLFHPFSTYAPSEICGYTHMGKIDKIRPSIFVLCPYGHMFPQKIRRSNCAYLSSCRQENDKEPQQANPRQNPSNFLLHLCIHRHVVAISTRRTFSIFH